MSLFEGGSTMSTDSDKPSDEAGTPEGASDPFLRVIEERYSEWEREFADGVHVRRTVPVDRKQ